MSKVFDIYSEYYDLLYHDKNYALEAEYIFSLINKFSPNSKKIVELGCGTGKHAKLLKERGFDIFGIDISEKMLEQAKQLGVDCQVADVRNFRSEKKFDSVLSLFHVVSYQITDEDVLGIFKTAYESIEKGGIFIFDLWYKPAVLSQLPEKRTKEIENSQIKVIRHCEPIHIKDRSMVEVCYDIAIVDKSNNEITNLKENHIMRYFSIEEIQKFSLKTGFEIIHKEEWLSGKTPDETTWGVCFVGVKK